MRKKLTALLALAAMSQVACYNSYFIEKSELEKLESSVEQQEVVKVYGDCPAGTASASLFDLGPLYAQNETPPAEAEEGSVDEDVMSEIEGITGETTEEATDATDATTTGKEKPATSTKGKPPAESGAATAPPGCTEVQVSTANALQLVTTEGNERVTPFNFIMSGGQLVSPEYDLLLQLEQVEGAKVREFSTFKTVSTIVLVSAVAVGTFVGISLLTPSNADFSP